MSANIPYGNDHKLMMALVEFYQSQADRTRDLGETQSKTNGTIGVYGPSNVRILSELYGREDHNRAVTIKNLLNKYVDSQNLIVPEVNKIVQDVIKTQDINEKINKKVGNSNTPTKMAIVYDKTEAARLDKLRINDSDTRELIKLYGESGVGLDIEGEITDADRKNPDIYIKMKTTYKKGGAKTGEEEVGKRFLSGKEKGIRLYKELLSAQGIDIAKFKDSELSRRLNSFTNKYRDINDRIAKGQVNAIFDQLKLPNQRTSIKAQMSVKDILALKGNYFLANGDFNFDILTGVKDCMKSPEIKATDLVSLKAIQLARTGNFGSAAELVMSTHDVIPNETIAKKYINALASGVRFPFIELENIVVNLINEGITKDRDHLKYQDIAMELVRAYSKHQIGGKDNFWSDEKVIDFINNCVLRVDASIPVAEKKVELILLKGGSKAWSDKRDTILKEAEAKSSDAPVDVVATDKAVETTKESTKKPAVEPAKVDTKPAVEETKVETTKETVVKTDVKKPVEEKKPVVKANSKKKKPATKPVIAKTEEPAKTTEKPVVKKETPAKVEETPVKTEPAKTVDAPKETEKPNKDSDKGADKVETKETATEQPAETTVSTGTETTKEDGKTDTNAPVKTGSVPSLDVPYVIDNGKVICTLPGTNFEYKSKINSNKIADDGSISKKAEPSLKNGVTGKIIGFIKAAPQSGQKIPEGFENYKPGDPMIITLIKQAS